MGGRLTQFLLALSLLLNAFVLAGFVYRSWIAPPEFERHFPPPGRPGGPLEQITHELGLSEDQRKALHDVFEKNQADRRQRFREILKIREQTGMELRKDPVDWAKVDALVDQLTKIRAEAERANLRTIVGIESQLTPQQREKLHTVLSDRFINPPRWMGPRGPGGPPPPRPPQ